MNEPKTPKLGLNKIDRSSPSTTYFDLDKYLDQNWEKVDEGVGQVEEKAEETAAQVSSIKERLNTEKRRSVTLEPGLQIINAERASAFKLEGLKGQTLVNLLGRRGNGESLSGLPVATNSAIIALDSTTKDLGTSSFKITATGSGSTEHYVDFAILDVIVGACYVLVAMAKSNAKANGRLMAYGIVDENPSDFFPESNLASATDRFTPVFLRFNPVTAKKVMVRLQVPNSSENALYVPDGQEVNFDSIRVYRITSEEYVALSNMTQEQVAAKYPYVDSVQPVRNPYGIRYGENLLPPFYEWRINDGVNSWVEGPYTLSGEATAANQPTDSPLISVPAGTTLTLTGGGNGANAYMQIINKSKTAPLADNSASEYAVFTATEETREFYVRAQVMRAGSHTIKYPMLSIGSTPKPFKPREDAMLALQTDLYADPLTGANADEVFEKDGQYFKLAKWKKIVMDSNYSYAFFNSYTGGKCVRLIYDIADRNKNVLPTVTKFNGSYLSAGSPSLYVDQYSRVDWEKGTSDAFLGIGVSSADSGWGEAYTPTTDEIKAYFMGWKMFNWNADGTSIYTGANGEIKAWCYRINGVSGFAGGDFTGATQVLLTTPAPNWTPYQLVYQLATAIVESITSEGQLTLIGGSNQVEVGTGILLREVAKPMLNATQDNYVINTAAGTGDSANPLNYKVDKFLSVYRNSKVDYKWVDNTFSPFGRIRKAVLKDRFDPSAAYSVTYFMLDKSPIAPFVGSVAENEKALLTNLNDIVQQSATRAFITEMTLSDAIKSLIQQQEENKWGRYKMAIVTKRLAKGSFTTTDQTVYTVPNGAKTLVKALTVCNRNQSAAGQFSVVFAGTHIISSHYIKSVDTITIPFLDQVLESGESISLSTATGGILTYYISGKEVT